MDTRRVLLVDDDPGTVRMAVSLLRDEPYRLLWATTSEDALQLARQHRPDAIVLSWTLPEMTGDELAEILHHDPNAADIPLILMGLEPWLFDQVHRDRAVQVVNKTYMDAELVPRVR
ncbi:MAG: response regulator, partial [Chloroflexota bacterium]|nr:response regulator [Chloroflexota bacterium]